VFTPYRGRGLRLAALLSFIGLVTLSSCTARAQPTATPRPTPGPVDIYIMLTDSYTSPAAILQVYNISADDATRIIRALQAVEPPAGLETLHQQALDAYVFICNGKLLLPGADNVLRSEALFMVDWGIARLWDYREQLAAWQGME